MPNCDMCGKGSDSLLVASVEGVELNVCNDCAKYGEIIRKAKPKPKKEKKKPKKEPPKEENIQVIVDGYNDKIKKAREKKGLKQEDFAKKIKEKVSLIQHIESGKFEPNIGLARKIERFLKINLIEQHVEKHKQEKGSSSENFTIGDFIKIRKRS